MHGHFRRDTIAVLWQIPEVYGEKEQKNNTEQKKENLTLYVIAKICDMIGDEKSSYNENIINENAFHLVYQTLEFSLYDLNMLRALTFSLQLSKII